MTGTRRWLGSITLLLFVASCTSYESLAPLATPTEADSAHVWHGLIDIGFDVRITLINGAEIAGKVVDHSPDMIKLRPPRRFGHGAPDLDRLNAGAPFMLVTLADGAELAIVSDGVQSIEIRHRDSRTIATVIAGTIFFGMIATMIALNETDMGIGP
jgi:hypothetical protein